MTEFTLQRVALIPEGCFSVLLHHGIPFAVTLERSYDDPKGQFVKIPAGLWHCTQTWFIRGGYNTYEVHIPGHTEILFHKGNLEEHSEGCILVGKSYTMFGNKPGIADSSIGLAEFFSRAGNQKNFDLEVKL